MIEHDKDDGELKFPKIENPMFSDGFSFEDFKYVLFIGHELHQKHKGHEIPPEELSESYIEFINLKKLLG